MTSADPGTTSEVGVKLFIAQTGAAVRQIPYKATAAQLSDLLGGHVDSMMENLPPLIGNLKDGRLRALAVTTKTRAASNPDVPTVAEQGYPDYQSTYWNGIYAPAGTPDDVIATLNKAFDQAVNDPDTKAKLLEMSFESVGGEPKVMDDFATAENELWSKFVKDNDIKMQ